MPKKVNLPDGKVVYFPDSMSDAQIRLAIESDISKSGGFPAGYQAKPAPSEPQGLIEQFQHAMERKATERTNLAGKEPLVPGYEGAEAAVTSFAPNVLASMAEAWRGITSPKSLGIMGATAIAPEIMTPYLAYQGGKQVATPQQPGESDPDYAQRVLMGGSQATGALAGAAGMKSPLRNIGAKPSTPQESAQILKQAVKPSAGKANFSKSVENGLEPLFEQVRSTGKVPESASDLLNMIDTAAPRIWERYRAKIAAAETRTPIQSELIGQPKPGTDLALRSGTSTPPQRTLPGAGKPQLTGNVQPLPTTPVEVSVIERATVDMKAVTKEMRRSITDTMRKDQPALVRRVERMADEYAKEGRVPIEKAEEFRRDSSPSLDSYYAKFPREQWGKLKGDPYVAAQLAKTQALREAIDAVIDKLPGPEGALLRKQYGGLNELRNALLKKMEKDGNITPGQFAMASEAYSMFRLGKGIFSGNIPEIIGAGLHKGVRAYMRSRYSTDSLIQRAFSGQEQGPTTGGAAPPASVLLMLQALGQAQNGGATIEERIKKYGIPMAGNRGQE